MPLPREAQSHQGSNCGTATEAFAGMRAESAPSGARMDEGGGSIGWLGRLGARDSMNEV
jgi:hypothetical protein